MCVCVFVSKPLEIIRPDDRLIYYVVIILSTSTDGCCTHANRCMNIEVDTHVIKQTAKPDLSFIKNYGGNPIVWQRIDEIVVFAGNGYIFHCVKTNPTVSVCVCVFLNVNE